MKVPVFDFFPRRRRLPATGGILFVLWVGLLAGCATVTFKRGASPDAMTADEDACRKTSTDEAAYAECLRNRGVYVAGTGGAAADPKDAEPPALGNTSGAAVETETAERAPAAAPVPIVTATPVTPAAAASPEASDPLVRVHVASWWKLGGTAADLDRAIDACVGEIGPAHRPDPGATVVTVGLRTCLRKAGWRAVAGSASR